MTAKIVIVLSIIVIVITWFVYYWFFGVNLGYKISKNPNDWAIFANYLTGTLTPILTFFSIVLLIRSLRLQTSANDTLESEMKRQKKAEQLAIFESRLFKAIGSQNSLLKDLELVININANKVVKNAGCAVDALEDFLEYYKEIEDDLEEIERIITEDIDTKGHIFSIIRKFYISVKLIDIHLSNDRGYSESDKVEYFELLINFSDFELLRLVLVGVKYCKYSMALSLAENTQFRTALDNLGYLDYLDEI
ncbi:hypothetical protein [Pseudoalteromonas arctica]|uniref:hypothetical protein n=1 Tax=Pseudoalteromonas arctica TaxID=394751 RepID=UPI00249569FF|nr:hypothetical protein [Pseudoalteromonas arctica]